MGDKHEMSAMALLAKAGYWDPSDTVSAAEWQASVDALLMAAYAPSDMSGWHRPSPTPTEARADFEAAVESMKAIEAYSLEDAARDMAVAFPAPSAKPRRDPPMDAAEATRAERSRIVATLQDRAMALRGVDGPVARDMARYLETLAAEIADHPWRAV